MKRKSLVEILSAIWDWYCILVVAIVTAFLILFSLFGGNVHFELYWNNLYNLFK